MSEHMRVNDVTSRISFTLFLEAFAIVNASLYFMFISKNWLYLYGTSLVFVLIANIFLSLQDESPKYYYG
jgi:predicted small integral membrane protein